MKASAALFMTRQARAIIIHDRPDLFSPRGNAVGATPKEVLSSPDCGNPETTKIVLAELGLPDMAAFSAKVGFPMGDPQLCVALGLAAGYHQGGKSVDESIAQAKKDAPAETKNFLGSEGYVQTGEGKFLPKSAVRTVGFAVLFGGIALAAMEILPKVIK